MVLAVLNSHFFTANFYIKQTSNLDIGLITNQLNEFWCFTIFRKTCWEYTRKHAKRVQEVQQNVNLTYAQGGASLLPDKSGPRPEEIKPKPTPNQPISMAPQHGPTQEAQKSTPTKIGPIWIQLGFGHTWSSAMPLLRPKQPNFL